MVRRTHGRLQQSLPVRNLTAIAVDRSESSLLESEQRLGVLIVDLFFVGLRDV